MIYLLFGLNFEDKLTPNSMGYGIKRDVTDVGRVERYVMFAIEQAKRTPSFDKGSVSTAILDSAKFFGDDYRENSDLAVTLNKVQDLIRGIPGMDKYVADDLKPEHRNSYELHDFPKFWWDGRFTGNHYSVLLFPEKVQFAVGDLATVPNSSVEDYFDASVRYAEGHIQKNEETGNTSLDPKRSYYANNINIRNDLLDISSVWEGYISRLKKEGYPKDEIGRLDAGSLA